MKLFASVMTAAVLASTAASAATVVYSETFDGYDLSSTAYGATSSPTSSTNNNSFTTDYGFRSGATSTGANSLYDEGTWTINTNPMAVHNLFVPIAGNNNMLILNGETSANGGNPAVSWASNAFAVSAGKFNYSFDIMNVCCNAQHPGTTVSVLWFYTSENGNSYELASGPAVTLTNPGQFYTQSGDFILQSGGTLQVAIFDTGGASDGNDFAIDNITVARVPEPMTWAMMLVGFGGIGAMIRRRRGALAVA